MCGDAAWRPLNSNITPIIRALIIDQGSVAADDALAGIPDGPNIQVSPLSWNERKSAASATADVIIVLIDATGRAAALEIVRWRPEVPVVVVTSEPLTDGAELIRHGVEEVVRLDQRPRDGLLPVVERAVARRTRAALARLPTASSPERTFEQDAGFRALAEALPAAVFIVRDNRIAYVNPTLCALSGYVPEELLGRDAVSLLDASATDEAATAVKGGDVLSGPYEVQIRTRDGEDRWIDLTVAPATCGGGAATIGIGIDISIRKRLESRTRQRQQFEALGRLAGGVAHDFNNLLLIISGGIQLINEKLDAGDPLRETAEAIAQAAERASLLTRDLLAFGRRQMLIARPVNISEIVAGLEGVLRDRAGAAVRFSTKLAANLPLVRVDAARLEQALVNLVANAHDAMLAGGSLVISTDLVEVDAAMREGRPWLPDGVWVRLMVADTGPGIPPDLLPHVFEPFFSSKKTPSSGLGLSAVLGIVKQSGGFVWIDSEPGEGARVTILLPPLEQSSSVVTAAVPTAATKPRVLLVEDQEGVRSLLTTVLERAGFMLHTVADAEAALELADQIDIDVLVTDVVLPGLNGLELAERIRTSKPGVQVLYMSGYVGDSVLSEDAEAEQFLHKPFATQILVERLRSLTR